MQINAEVFKLHPQKRIGYRRDVRMGFFITDAPCQRTKHATVRCGSEAAVAAVESGQNHTVYLKQREGVDVYVAFSDLH
jgi:hypothetical protein